MLPNTAFPDFGKALFALSDLLCAALIARILRRQAARTADVMLAGHMFLFNPVVLAISTRGSADVAVVAVPLLLLVDALQSRSLIAPVIHGISVHLKLFPAILVPAACLFVLRHSGRVAALSYFAVFGLTTAVSLMPVIYWCV